MAAPVCSGAPAGAFIVVFRLFRSDAIVVRAKLLLSKKASPMIRTQIAGALTIVFVLLSVARQSAAGDWPKLLSHPRPGTNTIALVNADSLRLGASKLKNFKGGEQKGDAANLVADLPENVKKAALSAFLDFDSLDPVWEMGTVIFTKGKLPPPRESPSTSADISTTLADGRLSIRRETGTSSSTETTS